MLGENGYPETPDWLPESRALEQFDREAEQRYRAMCGMDDPLHVRAERARRQAAATPLSLRADSPAHEAQPLTWDGDNA